MDKPFKINKGIWRKLSLDEQNRLVDAKTYADLVYIALTKKAFKNNEQEAILNIRKVCRILGEFMCGEEPMMKSSSEIRKALAACIKAQKEENPKLCPMYHRLICDQCTCWNALRWVLGMEN